MDELKQMWLRLPAWVKVVAGLFGAWKGWGYYKKWREIKDIENRYAEGSNVVVNGTKVLVVGGAAFNVRAAVELLWLEFYDGYFEDEAKCISLLRSVPADKIRGFNNEYNRYLREKWDKMSFVERLKYDTVSHYGASLVEDCRYFLGADNEQLAEFFKYV